MQTVARTTHLAAPFARANGLPVASRPVRGLTAARKHVARATDDPAEAAAAALEKASAAAKDAAKDVAKQAQEGATKLKAAINQATLDVDISQFLKVNFLAQVGLTAVSWFVLFTQSHFNMAKGSSVNPLALVLLVGVILAAYSAYLSFTYLTKSKEEGLGALDGWDQLNAFYEHANFNFLGAGAAILTLFGSVGTLMFKSKGSFALEALAQAASNVVLAHLVSLAFLLVMTRKIVQAYEKFAL